MSENSLRIREKYISKLFKKIQDLEDGINLLGQVDRRILRNSIQTGGAYLNHLESRAMYLQRGGSSSGGGGENDPDQIRMKEIQENALIQKARIDQQEDQLNKASATIRSLNLKTSDLRSTLENLSDLISSIKLKNVRIPKSYPFDLEAWNPILVYNAYHNIPFDKLINPPLAEIKDIGKKPEKLDADKKPPATQDDYLDWNIKKEDYDALVLRLKAKDQGKPQEFKVGSKLISGDGGSRNKILGEEGNFWILEKRPRKLAKDELVNFYLLDEGEDPLGGGGGGGPPPPPPGGGGSTAAPGLPLGSGLPLGGSLPLGRAPSSSSLAPPLRSSSLPLGSSSLPLGSSSLPLGSSSNLLGDKKNKYYSNSITSSEMPDHIMLSETSFF